MICHLCRLPINPDLQAYYVDLLGRWEYCATCYVHVPHPAGQTLAWWYAVERTQEHARDAR